MKMIRMFCIALLCCLEIPATFTFAQATQAVPGDTYNHLMTMMEKEIVGAADAMPADKYSFKPTSDQNTFAHLTIHIAESNNLFCSKLSGMAAPDGPKLAETDSKDKLVAAVKSSFDFCSTALAKLDDSNFKESITLFGNNAFSRARVILITSSSWADHYSEQAMYLRLNGVLPPTAQPAAH